MPGKQISLSSVYICVRHEFHNHNHDVDDVDDDDVVVIIRTKSEMKEKI